MKEIVLTEGKKDAIIDTVYFGGGTPSLLETEELGNIISLLKDSCDISPEAEWSLEANPDDVTKEKVLDWKNKGIEGGKPSIKTISNWYKRIRPN